MINQQFVLYYICLLHECCIIFDNIGSVVTCAVILYLQTVSWLGAEGSMFEECVCSVSEPTHLRTLLQHHKHLGHLDQHGRRLPITTATVFLSLKTIVNAFLLFFLGHSSTLEHGRQHPLLPLCSSRQKNGKPERTTQPITSPARPQ